jgi:hypothetical protein
MKKWMIALIGGGLFANCAWASIFTQTLVHLDFEPPNTGTSLHTLAGSIGHQDTNFVGIGAINVGAAAASGTVYRVFTTDTTDNGHHTVTFGPASSVVAGLNNLGPGHTYRLIFSYDQDVNADNHRYGLALWGTNNFNNGVGLNQWDAVNVNFIGGVNMDGPDAGVSFTHRLWTQEVNAAVSYASGTAIEFSIVETLGTPARNVFLQGSFSQVQFQGRMTKRAEPSGDAEAFYDNLILQVVIPEPSSVTMLVLGLGGMLALRRRRS